MKKRLIFALAALVSTGALAQATPGEGRGSAPPGTAADGSRPADGAITGGSILPGESGGVPTPGNRPEERLQRCDQLSGTLREQCLEQEASRAATGGTRAPDLTGERVPAPPAAPPPQNPR